MAKSIKGLNSKHMQAGKTAGQTKANGARYRGPGPQNSGFGVLVWFFIPKKKAKSHPTTVSCWFPPTKRASFWLPLVSFRLPFGFLLVPSNIGCLNKERPSLAQGLNDPRCTPRRSALSSVWSGLIARASTMVQTVLLSGVWKYIVPAQMVITMHMCTYVYMYTCFCLFGWSRNVDDRGKAVFA